MMQRQVVVFLLMIGVQATVMLSQSSGQERTGTGRIEDRTFVASNDRSQQQYVLVYPDVFSAGGPVSLLIALHGHGSDRWQFVRQQRAECQATRDVAARHGMLLVSPDYRAKTSWMGPRAESDLVQIISTLKKQFTVESVVISGGSMGGTGALTFTAMHPEIIDGVISLNGTANLVDYDHFSDAIAASFGGTRAEVPDEYRRRSAEFFPHRFTMPIAATTGGADSVVPPQSVLRLLEAIRKNNRHVLNIHRARGGHSSSYDDTVRALEFVIGRLQPSENRTR